MQILPDIAEKYRRLPKNKHLSLSLRKSSKQEINFRRKRLPVESHIKMQNDKLPPAPFFNSRKRLRRAVVADPNTDLENQETGWDSPLNYNNNNNDNKTGRISGQHSYPQQKSATPAGNYSVTFTSGQQRPLNQKISPRMPGQGNNSMSANRREYVAMPNNHGTAPYSRTPTTKPHMPNPKGPIPMNNQRTFTASNTSTTNAINKPMSSAHSNQNRNSNTDNKMTPRGYAQSYWNPHQATNRPKPRSPQPFQPTPCRQILGGESNNFMVDLPEADPAPSFAIQPQDRPYMEGAEKKVKPTTSKSSSQTNVSKKVTLPEKIFPVFSTTIQQLKQVYNDYKSKFNMIFEVYGVLDSAMRPTPAHTGKQFFLRDETDRIECVFYEIDRILPRLTRGHWQRCIGLADKEEGKLMCISVRPANIEERRAVQMLAPILDHHLQTIEQSSK